MSHDDVIEESQDKMVEAIYEHTMAVINKELTEFVTFLKQNGVKLRGRDESAWVESYIRAKWES